MIREKTNELYKVTFNNNLIGYYTTAGKVAQRIGASNMQVVQYAVNHTGNCMGYKVELVDGENIKYGVINTFSKV